MNALPRPAWRSRAWPLSGAAFVILLAALLAVGASGPLAVLAPSLIALTAVGIAVWAVWRTRRDRAAYESGLTSWAAAEAALAERLRIARDLHDIVSHGLGLITVLAAAARHVSAEADDPASPYRTALADIETTSRHATGELRRMLTVLRTTSDDTVPRLPLESLEDLPDIVRSAEVAGLRIRLDVADLGEVTRGVQVAVCRTVREALNNTARHAGPTDVRVRVHRDGDDVVVTVADRGPQDSWSAAPGAGHGLAGLRERIVGLGGSLQTELVDGGFHVLARMRDEVTR